MKSLSEHLHDLKNTWLFYDFEDEYKNKHYETLNENQLKEKEIEFYSNKFDLDIYFWGKSYPTYRAFIYERLEESLDSSYLIKKLKDLKYIIKTEQLLDSNTVVNVYVGDDFYNDEETYKKFESLLNFFNYFISRNIKTLKNENVIRIEARKPKKIDTSETLPFVYHITTKQAWEKIKRVGLSNKSHQKVAYHPKRIYCLSNKVNTNQLKKYAYILYGYLDDVVFLKINTNEFKEDREKIDKEVLSFYGDPQTPGNYGMFTLEYIPSKYIEKIEE